MPKKIKMIPYLACLAASLFSFYDLLQLAIFNVINMPLVAEFQFNSFTIGLFSSTFLISNAFGLLGLGLILDCYSARKIGILFILLTSLCSIGFGVSHSLSLDIIFRSIQGFASATSLLICIRMNTQWFKKHSYLAINVSIAIALCGGLTGNAVCGYLVAEFGWQNTLLLTGLLGLMVLYFMWLWLFDTRDATQCYPKRLNKLELFIALKNASFEMKNITAGIYLGLMSAPLFVLATLWGNYYLITLYHALPVQAAVFSSFIFIGMMMGGPLWGIISDRAMSPFSVMRLGCSVLILLVIMLYAGGLSLIDVGFIFFLIGFFSSTQNLMYGIVNQLNPYEIISTATAISAFFLNLIGALLQPLFGRLLLVMGLNSAILIVFLLAFSICFMLLYFIKTKKIANIVPLRI